MAKRVNMGLKLAVMFCLAQLGCSTADTPPERAPILLFNGTGTSANDVTAVAAILKQQGHEYATANSRQLNGMSDSQLAAYRLIIIPGGHYINMGRSLTPETLQRVRSTVNGGVNYLGICAGALLAGKAESNSLDLTSGVKFDFYAVVNQGVHKTAVGISSVDGSSVDHYWQDGPQLSGWGEVVGKYPDGTPAIVQDKVGQGHVILCGVHPEAPESWRRGMSFRTSTAAANDDMSRLIDSALNGTSLPHF